MTIEQVNQLRGAGSSDFRLIGFLADLGSYMLDSYLIVLCALETMLQGKSTLKEQSLIEELHIATIGLQKEGLIGDIQSCLRDTIRTALCSFAEQELVSKQNAWNSDGTREVFYSGKDAEEKQLNAVRESKDKIASILGYDSEKVQRIGASLAETLQKSAGKNIRAKL